VTLNDIEWLFALNSVSRRYVWSSEAWLSKLGYSKDNSGRSTPAILSLSTLKLVVNVVGELRKEQLRHRAVSLRQHGFLVSKAVVLSPNMVNL